jgi:phosphoglycolate phosphatase-like HAD superfamily hydrolase
MADTASRPRLILWDIDHTLIETRGAGSRFARAAFEEITGKRVDHMADATGKTEPVILAETLEAQGIEPSDDYQQRYAQALPEQYRRNAERLRQMGRVLPGAVEALAALRQVPGVIQTVLTGNYQAVAATKLATFALDELLDLDVGAYADDATDRAALVPIAQRRAADRYGHTFTRENTVIVGDTTHDVAAAHLGGAAITAVATADEVAAMDSCDSARAAVVHGHRAVAERVRREQLELARTGQPALVQRRAVAGDPGVDEQLVLVDQVQPVELGRELAASEEDPGRGRVLELLHTLA